MSVDKLEITPNATHHEGRVRTIERSRHRYWVLGRLVLGLSTMVIIFSSASFQFAGT